VPDRDRDQDRDVDVVVVGGGQSGLASAWYLRRAGLSHVVLDDQDRPGGAWLHTWPSLRLFSPASYSSLPGWPMPSAGPDNPDAEHVVGYLRDYEQRYQVPVHRPVRVHRVERAGEGFAVRTDHGTWTARAVVSATGTWSQPHWPTVPGQREFTGRQLHSCRYRGPEPFTGHRVLVVGGANSGAQVAADLLDVAEVTWCTQGPPHYLPDDVDGRVLFEVATRQVQARADGDEDALGVASLGDIVVVPPVRAARDAGLLQAQPMIERFSTDGVVWADGRTARVDDVIWCTGFRPALRHLRGLGLRGPDGRVVTEGPAVPSVPGLFLVGYGDWTGPASATLIGVGRTARWTVEQIGQRIPAR
jgi:putative flavoprotein involved in K+ transport